MAVATWRQIFDRTRAILRKVVVDAATDPDTYLKAFETVPRSIDTPDLPCAIVIPGGSTRQRSSGNAVSETRTINIYVYLTNAKTGAEGETEDNAIDFDIFDKVAEQFDGRTNLQLNGDKLVQKATLSADDGLAILPYPFNAQNMKEFFGVVFRLTVERTPKTNEILSD